MNSAVIGSWINVDPAEVIGDPEQREGVQVSPSPYDIPLALRINEGDPNDPAYAVEIGTKSGRVYRVLISTKLASSGARKRVFELTQAIQDFRVPSTFIHASTNRDMVKRALVIHEAELLRQLDDLELSHGHSRQLLKSSSHQLKRT